jgi:hypothetical protein
MHGRHASLQCCQHTKEAILDCQTRNQGHQLGVQPAGTQRAVGHLVRTLKHTCLYNLVWQSLEKPGCRRQEAPKSSLWLRQPSGPRSSPLNCCWPTGGARPRGWGSAWREVLVRIQGVPQWAALTDRWRHSGGGGCRQRCRRRRMPRSKFCLLTLLRCVSACPPAARCMCPPAASPLCPPRLASGVQECSATVAPSPRQGLASQARGAGWQPAGCRMQCGAGSDTVLCGSCRSANSVDKPQWVIHWAAAVMWAMICRIPRHPASPMLLWGAEASPPCRRSCSRAAPSRPAAAALQWGMQRRHLPAKQRQE